MEHDLISQAVAHQAGLAIATRAAILGQSTGTTGDHIGGSRWPYGSGVLRCAFFHLFSFVYFFFFFNGEVILEWLSFGLS